MSRITLLVGVVLLTLAGLSAAEDTPAPAAKKAALPEAWHGIWKGRVKSESRNGKTVDFAMELHIEPIEGRNACTWRIVYGEGDRRQVRPYELLPVDGKGHFRIDEKNGIVIDAFLIGDTIYSSFGLNKVRIDARYRLRGDALEFSIATQKAAPMGTTGGGAVPAVEVFELVAAQRATLRK